MYAAATSVALVGGDVLPIEVQVHVGRPQEALKLSGLPDTALREAKDRVRAAVHSSGVPFPNRTVTVNLAPAHLPKRGTDYDLAIALGVLSASGEIPRMREVIVVGELALDGGVRPGFTSLGAGVLSARLGMPCLVASSAADVAASVPGAVVHAVSTLAHAVEMLRVGIDQEAPTRPLGAAYEPHGPDLSEVKGQPLARRALEVAAAGGHHLLLHGPPGGGKTMLARRLPGILPMLEESEAVEVSLIHSAAGLERGLDPTPPFRAPHHTASRAALVGGGSGVATPGEVSLAHRGVLFLDELAEFPRANLDTLRQPLEDGHVSIARQAFVVRFPSRFQLVAATNPCPCGYAGDQRRTCRCRPSVASRYRQRLSGPLLDRFDLMVEVGRVEAAAMAGGSAEGSEPVRARVMSARSFRAERPDADGIPLLLRKALDVGSVTARGAVKVTGVARTIADLAGSERVSDEHLGEAMSLRVQW